MVNIQPQIFYYKFIQVLMMILGFLSDTFDSNILLHPLFILIMLSCWIIILNYILTPALIQSYKNKKGISKPHQSAFCAKQFQFCLIWLLWKLSEFIRKGTTIFPSPSNVPDYRNQSTFRISHDVGCGLPEECY